MGISKTAFMRGMQCPKMLWLDRHKPSLKIIPAEIQARLDAGNDFGDKAMGMFGPYEEMTVYRPGTTIPDTAAMLARTAEHLACAVDILRKTSAGYDIYEVKNTSELSEQFVKDTGFQYYILTRCGVKIDKIYIVLHGADEQNLFVPIDVTERAKGYYNWINEHIWELNRMQKEPTEPRIAPGKQCLNPYECWYYQYCHSKCE